MRGRLILTISLVALAAMTLWAVVARDAAALDGPHLNVAGNQACLACHVPHGSTQGTILLWGRTLSTKNFSWSDATATTMGTSLVNLLPAATKVTSGVQSSKYCLSCHDGTLTNIPFGGQISSGDLKGSHPVAVPYPFGAVANKYNNVTSGSLAVGTAVSGKWNLSPDATKVKLFTDASAAAPNNRGIECASCHNPHEIGSGSYLRDPVATLCTRCHLN